jgi:Xaa-Pro aminopeptidase
MAGSSQRITQLQTRLKAERLEAFLVSNLKNIRYLTGFTGTTGYLVVRQKGATLFVDSRYTEQARMQAAMVTVAETARDVLGDVLKNLQRGSLDTLGFEAARSSYAEYSRIEATLADVRLCPTTGWVEEQRAVKDGAEVAALRQAVEIADAAYEDFLGWIKPGMTEREAAARLEFYQRSAGGDRKPSETIVASGPRTALPHGIATDRLIQPGEPVMIDIGIVVEGYTSDLTRTIHLGPPPAQFEEIYRIVGEAQLKAQEGLRPGMTGREVDAIARDHIAAEGYGAYFGHSLGHSVGLEIHERPGFSMYEDAIIEPGMVVTVEPGIYLSGRFGVRTEDIILVTDSGCEVLTRCSHELKVL